MFRRVTGLTFIGFAAACTLPQKYFPDSLKPVNHMLNVAKAGVKMASVYKFSSKTTQQKNVQASSYLKEALLQSGGVYVKLGQLIATLDVIVPDQFRTSLMALTRECRESSFESVKQTIQQQLNAPLQSIFNQFNEIPVSSASIGQVHKARLKNGQEVAVKVQHSNLLQNVNYDLALMHSFVTMAKYLFGDDFKYGWLIQQFQKNIHKELDFVLEAGNITRVQKLLKDQKIKNVVVPFVAYPPSKRLLVMEYIHGFNVNQTQKIKQQGINSKQIGKSFSNLMTKMIHKYGFVHADPHSGNLLVRKSKKGKDELVLLDHGLYQELDTEIKTNYNRFWLGLILNDQDMFLKAAYKLGTKNGILLCCMLTSKTRDELATRGGNLFDLNPSSDKGAVLKHATQWQKQIVQVLNQIRREILLVLKVNQFARSIQNTLGGRQMGVYQDIAKCCVENLGFSRWQKFKFYWRMYWSH